MHTSSVRAAKPTRHDRSNDLSGLDRSARQIDLPIRVEMQAVDPVLIYRLESMTAALQLGQTLSGKDDKRFVGDGGIVKDLAQWSRIMHAGRHNFPHDKYSLYMDLCGNEVPLLYLLHSRGYDLSSLRLRETETERQLRQVREENTALRRVLLGASV